jgi:hypothetical protein
MGSRDTSFIDNKQTVFMDLHMKTPEELALLYLDVANFVKDNLATLSNEVLANVRNKSTELLHASINQNQLNLEETMILNQNNIRAYEKLAQKMKFNSENHSIYDKVTLDVGGKTFSTFKETLMRFENTYFCGLLNSGRFDPGPDGNYFIDRSPVHFELIMTYFRTGEISKNELKPWEIEDLKKELDYYLLPIPNELNLIELKWDLSTSKLPTNATFSENNLTITKTSGGDDWNCPVIASTPMTEFTVKITSQLQCHHIMIGFCPSLQFVQNKGHCIRDKNICMLYSHSGNIYYDLGKDKPYSSPLKVNDSLTAIKNGSFIRFLKNGIDLGIAIDNALPEMYPIVELYSVGASVTIVQNPDELN